MPQPAAPAVRIRRARPDDYPRLAEIRNAQNEPDHHRSPEGLLAAERALAARGDRFRRWVAVLDEDGDENGIVATGTLRGDRLEPPRRGHAWIDAHVRSDLRGHGIDARLVRHALAHDPGPPSTLWSVVRSDFVAAAGYLGDLGFGERYRSWGSHLDLDAFDPARFAPRVARLERQGVHAERLEPGRVEPALERALLALQRRCEADAPAFEPVIPRHLPPLVGGGADPDQLAAFVAFGPDGPLGLASLVPARPGGMVELLSVGVAPGARRRGIGTALVVAAAEHARSLGMRDVNAGGGGGLDGATPRLLAGVGFALEPAWVTFSLKVGPA